MDEIKKQKTKEELEKELFDDKNVPEVSGYFKFKTKGDRIFGTLIIPGYIKPSTIDGFKDQKIYELLDASGVQDGVKVTFDTIKVGISVDREFVTGKADKADKGDLLGFEYKDDYQTPENKKKGFQPAKSIEVFVRKTK